MGFFRQRGDEGLEDRLRSLRGEPRADFVRGLSGHIRESHVRKGKRSRRLVAALVTSALMLIPFVAFGGVSYAVAAAENAVEAVVATDNARQNDGNDPSPAEDQYKPGKGCGDDNHDHERKDECKEPPK